MTTQYKTPIRALIEAVESGTFMMDALPWPHEVTAYNAFSGSLDAAKALHDALLPGWRARVDTGRRHRAWVISPENRRLDAYSESPARAWLLAILRAYEAQQ